MANTFRFDHAQRGSALIVGLIFLVLITLVGITAMSSTVLQERMTGGQRNESLAFNGSESALRGAERGLWQQFAKADGVDYEFALPSEPMDKTGQVAAFRATGDWSTDGLAYSTIDYPGIAAKAGGGKLDRAPHYIVERLGPPSACPAEANTCGGADPLGNNGMAVYYRITSRSTGGDARVRRTDESVYAVAR